MGHHETERTYEVPAGASVPELGEVRGVRSTSVEPVLSLTATYLDTAGLDLLRHGITLRRREGGDDDGWHLKLPLDAETREEVHAPLAAGRRQAPRQLRELVLAITLGEPLVEVATIRTLRARVLLEAEGVVLAELADDRVSAECLLPESETEPDTEPDTLTWREWEVELVEGRRRLLDDVEKVLVTAGVEPSGRRAKLGRVLGDAAAPAGPKEPRKGKAAARVLHAYLAEQRDQVLAADLAVRRREPAGVHDLRVALRRLRTALATFRPLVDRDVTDPLREQMREISHLLGDLRDAEVVTERLRALLDEEPADLRIGVARRTLGDDGRTMLRVSRRTLDDTLRSPEYVAMLRDLRELVADPPWRERASEAAADVVPARIAADLRRLRTRLAAADEAGSAAERARLLHEARKAAKRLRYACEAGAPVLGAGARRLRAVTHELQDVLGDHHDTMATRSVLRRLAGRADLHPGTTFTLGRLHAREEQAARRLERDVAEVWGRLDRTKVTGWL